jgi:hypothetical protein
MKIFTALLLAATSLASSQALACSANALQQKQKAYSEAVKTAFARDPAGDAARRAKVQDVVAHYVASLKNVTHGSTIIDTMCRENDELLAIYQ